MKECTQCFVVKPLEKFPKRKSSHDGVSSWCSECKNRQVREYSRKAPERRLLAPNQKTCSKCHELKVIHDFPITCSSKDGYKSYCKECLSKANAEKYLTEKEKVAEKGRIYRVEKAEHISRMRKKRYRENIEKHREQKRNDYEKHKEKRIAEAVKYRRERYASDPVFNIEVRCRARILGAFRNNGFTKRSSTGDLVGCSFEFLKNYLEERFLPGMTWDNRSEWHIDHIIPVASAKNEEEVVKLFHYTNLQPLWAKDNHKKGAKTPDDS